VTERRGMCAHAGSVVVVLVLIVLAWGCGGSSPLQIGPGSLRDFDGSCGSAAAEGAHLYLFGFDVLNQTDSAIEIVSVSVLDHSGVVLEGLEPPENAVPHPELSKIGVESMTGVSMASTTVVPGDGEPAEKGQHLFATRDRHSALTLRVTYRTDSKLAETSSSFEVSEVVPLNSVCQRRTMAEIRTISSGVAAWFVDNIPGDLTHVTTLEELAEELVPEYFEAIPMTDAWGHRIECLFPEGGSGRNWDEGEFYYRLRSPGCDGVFQKEEYAVGSFPIEDCAEDIVSVDGVFIRWPEPQE